MIRSISTLAFSSVLAVSMLNVNPSNEEWYAETLYPNWQQRVKIDRPIEQGNTTMQDLVIFENDRFGKVLALDGVIQMTEADEFIYHEMMVHVPIIAHGSVEKVLIIGGGDGGSLREVVRHKNIQKIVMVEIDQAVIDFAKEHLPKHSSGAFDDPRLELVIADGSKYVQETEERFDVILCDSTDPIGPGEVLFTKEFYGNCKNILNAGGIFVNQNGVPFLQGFEITDTFERRKPFFKDTSFFLAPIPTYVGGFMAFGWATDTFHYRDLSNEELAQRIDEIEGELNYYNAEIHKASFALPNFVKRQFNK